MNNINQRTVLNSHVWWCSLAFLKVILLTLLLGVGTSAYANQDYQANIQKLNIKANKTKELFVAPNFNFNTYKTLTLDILVLDETGLPRSNKLLLVSSVPTIAAADENQDIEKTYAQKSVISLARTDEFGRVYKQIEVSNLLTSILIELNEKTSNNRVLLALPDSLHVSHTFEIK
ncbi:hypothetical protein [Paraglaciecola sp.]|uniref:hypothetical protein n=1 Tax=Paraglaciecola sp. TaxID=1920173 RepID=UPI003EF34284